MLHRRPMGADGHHVIRSGVRAAPETRSLHSSVLLHRVDTRSHIGRVIVDRHREHSRVVQQKAEAASSYLLCEMYVAWGR